MSQHDPFALKHQDFSGEPLTEAENKKVRAIIDADAKARWAWATFRTWVMYFTVVATGVAFGWETFKKVAQAIMRVGGN